MTNNTTPSSCTDNLEVFLRLVVDDAAKAIDFYCVVFDATELVRFTDPSGKIVHAEVQIGASVVSMSESDDGDNRSPTQLGGSPTIAMVTTPDVDGLAHRMLEHGGRAIFPVDDREYGRRDGRYADPEGHLWILTQAGPDLTDEQIQERLDSDR